MYIVLTVTLRGGNFTDSEKSEYNQDASKVEYFSKYNIHPTTCSYNFFVSVTSKRVQLTNILIIFLNYQSIGTLLVQQGKSLSTSGKTAWLLTRRLGLIDVKFR